MYSTKSVIKYLEAQLSKLSYKENDDLYRIVNDLQKCKDMTELSKLKERASKLIKEIN